MHKKATVKNIEETRYSKEQILQSKKYSNRKDIIGVLLEDGKQYSFQEVDTLMNKFMKGKVK